MARSQKQQLPVKTFAKGFLTEVNPLTFPIDASIDEINMELLPDGTRKRRKGLQQQGGTGNTTGDTSELSGLSTYWEHNTYLWRAVNNRGGFDFYVVRSGDNVSFYRNNRDDVMANGISTQQFAELDPTKEVKFTDAYGKLIMTLHTDEVVVFTYNDTGDYVEYEKISLTVRDLWNIDTGLPTGDRIFSAPQNDPDYLYNQFNCGWPWATWYLRKTGGGSDRTEGPTNIWQGLYGVPNVWPAEADVFHDYTFFDGNYTVYSARRLQSSQPSTGVPLRGKAILDLFNRGASREEFYESVRGSAPAGGFPQDRTVGTISVVASFAGRIFYAVEVEDTIETDSRSPNLGTMIFYSQVADNVADMGKCYARNDPTSEDRSDPLATDGGFITIPEMGQVLAMEVVADSLIVVATNGVWEIYGGDAGFSATDQTVSKVATVFGAYGRSIVKAGDAISFWTADGILVVSKQPGAFQSSAVNLTKDTIQTYYNSIPSRMKDGVTGTYIPDTKQIRWLYHHNQDGNDYDGDPQPFRYNRELIFHTEFGAFTKNKFHINNFQLPVGYRPLSLLTSEVEEETVVTSGGATVTDSSLNDVTVEVETAVQSDLDPVQYLVIQQTGAGSLPYICTNSNDLFADHSSLGPVPAFLLTGYAVGSDSSKDLRAPYVTVHFRRTETGFSTPPPIPEGGPVPEQISFDYPSGCYLQGQWEWTDSAAAGKWSTKRQAYRLPRFYVPEDASDPFDYSYQVVTTRNKMRGTGRALSLLFESEDYIDPDTGELTEAGKDMHIHGWSIEIVAETD